MSDYREMYLKMVKASEQAVNILIAAQQACEELYITLPEMRLAVVPLSAKKEACTEEESL